MITFLAPAHMLDATQLVGDDNIPCTCTHVGCYATVGVGVGWDGMLTFVAHEHMFDAPQQLGLGWGGM